MNNGNLKGSWSELRGPIRNHWSQLTEEDIREISGKADLLLDKLQERYGYTKAEAERRIEQFINRLEPKLRHAKKQLNNIVKVGSHLNARIKKAPWTLALVTGIGGFVLGFALNRKNAIFKSRRWFS